MNWTGGSLQRSKTAPRGSIQKQKAHFARARTKLQDGGSSVATSFHPNYIVGNGPKSGDQLPSAKSKPLHLPGHLLSLRHGRGEQDVAMLRSKTNPSRGLQHRSIISSRALNCHSSVAASPRSTKAERLSGKRKTAHEDAEARLLEAKWSRRLNHQEWVGGGPSQPLIMHFPSSKEKGVFGKRRKVETNTNPRENHPQLPRFPDGRHHDPYMGGALQNHVEDIRIRIGTGALTDNRFSQPSDQFGSQTSSDPILFEPREFDDAHSDSIQPTGPAQWNDPLFVGVTRSITTFLPQTVSPRRQAGPNRQLNGNDKAHLLQTSFRHDAACNRQGELSIAAEQVEDEKQQNEVTSGCQIIQDVRGVNWPLQLVFDGPFADVKGHNAWQRDNTVGETKPVYSAANARLTKSGHAVHQVGSPHEQLNVSLKTTSSTSIVDEEPGKGPVAIADKISKNCTTSHGPRNILLAQPGLDVYTDRADWSPHRTINETYCSGSTSYVSASLPSLDQLGEKTLHEDQVMKQSLDENERLWRIFVFGSDGGSERGTTHVNDRDEADTSYLAQKGQSRSSPSCVADRPPVSSTPFRTVSEFASCISGDVQDAAACAPLLTSSGSMLPANTSPEAPPSAGCSMQILMKSEQVGEGPVHTAEHDAFGEQLVTHSSMQNKTSWDGAAASWKHCDPRTSRSGLDRCIDPRDELLGPVQAKRSESEQRLQRSSICEVFVSDDGIDLIDPDRLI